MFHDMYDSARFLQMKATDDIICLLTPKVGTARAV